MRYAILIVLLCIISSPMRGQERAHVSLDLRTRVYSKIIFNVDKIIDTVFRKGYADDNDSINIETEAYFFNAKFLKRADFSLVHFLKGASFSDAQFLKGADFSCAQFPNPHPQLVRKGCYFGLEFSELTYFLNAQFSNDVIFSRAQFSNDADFSSAQFSKGADFSDVQFLKGANFSHSQFSKGADFSDVQFLKGANFSRSQFSNSADFSHGVFSNLVDFTDVQFSKQLSLNSIFLSDSVEVKFKHSLLPDWVDFSRNTGMKNEVDFTAANFDSASKYSIQQKGWHYINLYKTDLARVKIDYTHFRFAFYSENSEDLFFEMMWNHARVKHRGILYDLKDSNLALKFLADTAYRARILKVFPGAGYYACDAFMATLRNKIVNQYAKGYLLPKWFGTALPPLTDSVLIAFTKECITNVRLPKLLAEDEVRTMYEQEIKILSDRGAMQSKQNLDIEYQDYMHGENFIPHIWNCYGYHKEWVFYWTGIFIVLFSFLTFWCLQFLSVKVYKVSFFSAEDVAFKTSSIRLFFKHLIARVWYSFVYTAVIFFLFSLKIENFKFHTSVKRILGTAYVILVYTMGIICLAYMAGFVLQK